MEARDQAFLTHVVQVFKMLSDKHHLHILVLLAHEGELSVPVLCQATGQAPDALQHHMTRLCMAGLVGYRRQGQQTLYSIRDKVVHQVLQLVQP